MKYIFHLNLGVKLDVERTLSSSPCWLFRTCVHSHSSPSPLIDFMIHHHSYELEVCSDICHTHFNCFFIIVAVDWTVVGGATGTSVEVHVATLEKKN